MSQYLKQAHHSLISEIGVNYPIYDLQLKKIVTNIYVEFKKSKSSLTLEQKIDRYGSKGLKTLILLNFDKKELNTNFNDIVCLLNIRKDIRLKYLLKKSGFGPYCKINIDKTDKKSLSALKGIYFFYDKSSYKILYVGEAKKSFKRLFNYFNITPGKVKISGQGTSVRVNNLINNYINLGNEVGIGVIPVSNLKDEEISNLERLLIKKFSNNNIFWNKNDTNSN